MDESKSGGVNMEFTGQFLASYEGTSKGIFFLNIDKGQRDGSLALFGEEKINLFCSALVKEGPNEIVIELSKFLPINNFNCSIDSWASACN